MGIYGGILGAVFNNIWHWINCKRQRLYLRFRIHKNWIKLFEVGFVSLTTSSLSFALPLAFSRACRPVDVNIDYSNDDFTDDASLHQFWNATIVQANSTYGFSHQFNCKQGERNELANILFGSRGKTKYAIAFDHFFTYNCNF